MVISKLSLEEKYQPKVLGLGEIYEIISVEKQRRMLRRKFSKGIIFLAPNKNHRGQGLDLGELEKKVCQQRYQTLTSGFVDSPLWKSKSRQKGKSPLLAFSLLLILAKFVFKFLVIFEPLWQGKKNSHMLYVLGRKR